MLSPEFQARTDWRNEGCFHPDQYAEGSMLKVRYMKEMEFILAEDGESQ